MGTLFLMALSCDEEWKNYNEVVKTSSVRCLEVVVEKGCSPFVVDVDDNVDVEPIENLTQDEALQPVVVRELDRSFELDTLNDEFDVETFAEDNGNGDGTYDIDDIQRMTKLMLPQWTKMTLLQGQVLF